jgi:methyl-accepting chemotaxis protein
MQLGQSLIIGGIAFAAAFVSVLIGYTFELEQDIAATGLRFLTTWVITFIALSVAKRLPRPEKTVDTGIEQLAPAEAAPPFDEPLDAERLSRAIFACSPFVHDLSKYVQGAVSDTEQAAVAVMTKLRRAEDVLEELVRNLQGSTNKQIIPIIEQTQDCLRANNELFSLFLVQRNEAMEESRSRLGCLTDWARNLDGIALSIRELARQTNLLALNATIEAARVGDTGRGFAVVASDVEALSLQSDRAAKDIDAGLQTLKAAIDESIEALTIRQARDEKTNLESITQKTDELSKDLNSLVQQQQELVAKTQQDNKEIAQIVMDLVGSMQFQDLVRQKLDLATENLEHVVSHAVDITTLLDAMRAGKNLSFVANHAEASVHDRGLSVVPNKSDKLIELF